MRRFGSMVAVGLLGWAGAAQAQEVPQIESCDLQVEEKLLLCEVTNNGVEAMTGMVYDISIKEEGRTAPWGLASAEIRIWGGIEPDETMPMVFEIDGLPETSWDRDLAWEVDAIGLDEDGSPVLTAEAKQARDDAWERERQEREEEDARRAAELEEILGDGSGGDNSTLGFLRSQLGLRAASEE